MSEKDRKAIIKALGGNENRISERLRGVASDMRTIGASSMTPHELFAYWAREVDKAADLAAMLGEPNPDGLPCGLTISDDGSLLNWRGENYVRQSTLGEQPARSGAYALVRRARDMARSIQGNLGRCLYRRKDVAEMEEVSETLMELANELNAAMGGGECELVYGENDHGDDGWWCQSCGEWFAASFRHTKRDNIIEPRYCQQCGKAVKR